MVHKLKNIINRIKTVVLLLLTKVLSITHGPTKNQELENEMAKKKQELETVELNVTTGSNEVTLNNDVSETLEQLKQASILNELALGIARTKDGWGVVQIAYNAETGESDLQDVQVAGTSRDDAIELFKITAVEKGLV